MPRSEPEGQNSGAPLRIARVAVEGAPLHLGETLDYLAIDGLRVGHRVEVSLAGRRTRGLVAGIADRSEVARSRLRPVGRLLGDEPWTDDDGLALLRWAAARFGAPLADVVRHALPARVLDEERRAEAAGWWPPRPGGADPSAVDDEHPRPSPPPDWRPYGGEGAALVGAVESGSGSFLLRPLPGEDLAALITDLAARTLAGGRSVMVVVPGPVSEIADRVLRLVREEARADLRGGPTPRMVYRAWLRARAGRVRLVVGERSAAFLPLPRMGLAVVIDEADPTHKERRSPRHHARDVLLERARRAQGVGLCTVDIPSAVARALLDAGRLRDVGPAPDDVAQRRPSVRLETGDLEARTRISRAGLQVLRRSVAAGGYGVVLAARRGEGRALVCRRCGDLVRCTRCSASVARASDGGWWCAACGSRSSRPPRCDRCGPTPLVPLAAGAERIGEELARTVDAPVAVLEGHAPEIPSAPAVLVMTRGAVLDHPPRGGVVRGVVLPDLDGSLRRPTLDAAEDALRLAFRVAGWTVASARPDGSVPDVVVETRDPTHHALRSLVAWDAHAFWDAERKARAPLGLPPWRGAIRIEAPDDASLPGTIRQHTAPGDVVVGPSPCGPGRIAILILVDDRSSTLDALRPVRDEASRRGSDLRVDVDPIDLG